MLQSMTGFGKAEVIFPDKKVTIEIKSLNGKNSDTNVKLPVFYREKEVRVRKILQDVLKRGKLDCYINYEINEGASTSIINVDVFKTYFHQIQEIKRELKIPDEDIISSILRLPDSIRTTKTEVDDQEWEKVEEGILTALGEVQKFRQQEGKSLAEDISASLNKILKLLTSVEPFEKGRIERIREKISKSLEDLNLKEGFDTNRLEQEMIYYIEKLDISEEKSRLENHCTYFIETMKQSEETGKKLNFISQEMGREINTLGSKANDSEIQKIVVQMKDELEKIKEQTLNIL